MTFGLDYLTSKLGGLRDKAAIGIAGFDPDGAIEAEITGMRKDVDAKGIQVAEAASKAEAADKVVTDKQSEYDNYKTAALAVKAKFDEGDATQEALLTKFVTKLEEMKASLVRSKEQAVTSHAWHEEIKGIHRVKVDQWTHARESLDKARNEMEQAKQEEQQALSVKAEREKALGLSRGIDQGAVALSAMEERARAAHVRAEAARATSTALGAATAVDDEMAKAIKAVSSTPNKSAADRLKDL